MLPFKKMIWIIFHSGSLSIDKRVGYTISPIHGRLRKGGFNLGVQLNIECSITVQDKRWASGDS